MAKAWKTPTILRLSRIEQWRRERFERALKGGDYRTAKRAADLYTAVSARADSIALGSIHPYSDRD
ncbi:hypothetical protein [Bradyrhizobium sp. CCBAU 53421]|uniref:hypothetical protein n=1 Tax=Bradyrhizobium sp. CCBAU 53421 TaxID=1325120 RepID=UPI00188AE41B|nr:hypothetical protein [Bradyrhizobium sp. CCBAU 53421]